MKMMVEKTVVEVLSDVLQLPKNKGKRNKHTALVGDTMRTAIKDPEFAGILDLAITMEFNMGFVGDTELVDNLFRKLPFTLYAVLLSRGLVKPRKRER